MIKDQFEYREECNDYHALTELYNIVGLGFGRTIIEVRTVFENSKYVITAFHKKKLIGAGRAFGDEFDCTLVCDLAVNPEFQGKGIGSHIVDALLKKVRHHKRIILYSEPGKETFYQKFGFKKMKTAMMASYYLDEELGRRIGFIE